jgi:predicted nucleic acid-binding protein
MTRAFLDSNVLVYAFTDCDPRQERALELLERGHLISVQCLNEFANVASRKLGIGWDRVAQSLDEIRVLCPDIRLLDLRTHALGLEMARLHRFSVWDAMIVAAALVAGCETLYSEDMHAGLVVDGRLTIVNPFAA